MINALPVLTSVPMLNHAEQKLFSVTKVVDSSGKKKKRKGRKQPVSCTKSSPEAGLLMLGSSMSSLLFGVVKTTAKGHFMSNPQLTLQG